MQIPVLLFFDISAGELIVILLVAFVVFGPSRIPEIARKIGRGISEVRRASDEIKREITRETKKMENSLSVDDLDLTDTKRNKVRPEAGAPLKKGDQTNQVETDKAKEEPQTPEG